MSLYPIKGFPGCFVDNESCGLVLIAEQDEEERTAMLREAEKLCETLKIALKEENEVFLRITFG